MPDQDEAARQAELRARRAALVAQFRESWARMIRIWRAPRQTDAVWLIYAGNYLFNTGGLRWAVDPIRLSSRLPEAPVFDVRQDLEPLSLVLLTHAHTDHVDIELWRQLRELPCRWIVPEHMVSFFLRKTGMARGRISVATPAAPIEADGMTIIPFDGLHDEQRASGELHRVPATGYLVEIGDRRYLLPGDIRTYDMAALPVSGPVTAVFAHLFLGRSAALQPHPPLLNEFVEFYQTFRPQQILLTHLYDLARSPADCWCESHAHLVRSAFAQLDHDIEVAIPPWYEEIVLHPRPAVAEEPVLWQDGPI